MARPGKWALLKLLYKLRVFFLALLSLIIFGMFNTTNLKCHIFASLLRMTEFCDNVSFNFSYVSRSVMPSGSVVAIVNEADEEVTG